MSNENTVFNNSNNTQLDVNEKTRLGNASQGRTILDVTGNKAVPRTPQVPPVPRAGSVPPPVPGDPKTTLDNSPKTTLDNAPKGANAPAAPEVTDPSTIDTTPTNGAGKKSSSKTGVAAGVGAAIGVAGGAAVAMSMDTDEPLVFEEVEDLPVEEEEVVAVVEESVTGVPFAHGVSDSMSFGQAFAAARAEVGPGGAFTWHGQTYNTYTEQEWNSMSPAQQHDYAQAAMGNPEAAHSGHYTDYTAHTDTPAGGEHVGGSQANGQFAYNGPDGPDDPTPAPGPDPEPEVQVLGVVHDADSDFNIGVMSVGDEMVAVIDVDSDLTFDVMWHDDNHDGTMQESELQVLDGDLAGLSVDDLGGFTDGYTPDDSMMADNVDNGDYGI